MESGGQKGALSCTTLVLGCRLQKEEKPTLLPNPAGGGQDFSAASSANENA